MLKDVVERVKKEVEEERTEREEVEGVLLNLLEEACNKLKLFTGGL